MQPRRLYTDWPVEAHLVTDADSLAAVVARMRSATEVAVDVETTPSRDVRFEHYELTAPGGAFYLFPKAPWGTGTEFVTTAIRNNLLIIPGGTFSRRDTHFRISYATDTESLREACRRIQAFCEGLH